MPKFAYALTNGKTLTLEGDTQPSDAEAEQAAKDAGVSLQSAPAVGSPEERQATNAALVSANEKPLPATPSLAAEFTPAKMGERALAGLKGEAKGFAGGIAAPVLALGAAVRHPMEAVDAAGKAALMLGAAGYNAVTRPADTYEAAKAAALRIGADPESIGAVAGGVGAMLATPALAKAGAGTRVGRALAAGASAAADRIPGVAAAREAFTAAAPMPVSRFQNTPRLVKGPGSLEDALAAELRKRIDTADVPRLTSNPVRAGADITKGGNPSAAVPGARPDLMGQYQTSVAGPAKPFEMGGVRYAPNAEGSHVATPPTPIEQFYASNPGAATGGEGRMTGQFKEGPGGLSDPNIASAFAEQLANRASELPPFTFEGESTVRPGEYPPGPSVDLPSRPGRALPGTVAPVAVPAVPAAPRSIETLSRTAGAFRTRMVKAQAAVDAAELAAIRNPSSTTQAALQAAKLELALAKGTK